jgi:hypothetical protein
MLIFVMEKYCVLFEVRNEFLNIYKRLSFIGSKHFKKLSTDDGKKSKI